MTGAQKVILGIFFATAFAILAIYTVFLTDFRLFGSPETETVYFTEAYGLEKGSAVLVLGHRTGRVEEVLFDIDAPPERRIQVTLSLDEPIELFSGSRIVIKESSMLGGRSINIYPGPAGGGPMQRESDGSLIGEIELNPVARLGDLGIVFQENREAARNIRTDASELWDDFQSGRGTFGRFAQDETLSGGLFGAFEMVQGVGGEMETGQGLFTMLMNDTAFVDDIRGMADRFNSIGTDLAEGEGLAGKLVYEGEIITKIETSAELFNAVGEGVSEGRGWPAASTPAMSWPRPSTGSWRTSPR